MQHCDLLRWIVQTNGMLMQSWSEVCSCAAGQGLLHPGMRAVELAPLLRPQSRAGQSPSSLRTHARCQALASSASHPQAYEHAKNTCWQDLPSGALEPWTSIQVTDVFNSADNSSNGRRLLQATAPSYASLDSAGAHLASMAALLSCYQQTPAWLIPDHLGSPRLPDSSNSMSRAPLLLHGAALQSPGLDALMHLVPRWLTNCKLRLLHPSSDHAHMQGRRH